MDDVGVFSCPDVCSQLVEDTCVHPCNAWVHEGMNTYIIYASLREDLACSCSLGFNAMCKNSR